MIGRGGLDVGGAGRASLAGGEGNKGGLEDVEGCCENGRVWVKGLGENCFWVGKNEGLEVGNAKACNLVSTSLAKPIAWEIEVGLKMASSC